jgi:co-chaperonin GroES (HSP10)
VPQEIDLKSAVKTNVLNLGGMTLEASADRIIVVEDEFKSGYECLTCEGVGSLVCENCNGTGKSSISKDARCSQCQGRKSVVCPECKGKTVVEGGIVVPEASIRRPTTGTVVSTGPDVKRFERGQSVIYTSFSGHVFELNAYDMSGREIVIVIRVIQESDILAKVSGHLELRRVKKSAAVGSAA